MTFLKKHSLFETSFTTTWIGVQSSMKNKCYHFIFISTTMLNLISILVSKTGCWKGMFQMHSRASVFKWLGGLTGMKLLELWFWPTKQINVKALSLLIHEAHWEKSRQERTSLFSKASSMKFGTRLRRLESIFTCRSFKKGGSFLTELEDQEEAL